MCVFNFLWILMRGSKKFLNAKVASHQIRPFDGYAAAQRILLVFTTERQKTKYFIIYISVTLIVRISTMDRWMLVKDTYLFLSQFILKTETKTQRQERKTQLKWNLCGALFLFDYSIFIQHDKEIVTIKLKQHAELAKIG